MIYEPSPRFRAWLDAFAGQRPELHERFDGELVRLRAALDASESDRRARLELILEQQRRLDELMRALSGSEQDRAARLEAIGCLQRSLDASQLDSAARLEMIRGLESASEVVRQELERLQGELARIAEERAAWLRILPGLRIRIPGGRGSADRMRRWFGRAGG